MLVGQRDCLVVISVAKDILVVQEGRASSMWELPSLSVARHILGLDSPQFHTTRWDVPAQPSKLYILLTLLTAGNYY